MELWVTLLIRAALLAYAGAGVWLTVRVLRRSGLSWGWALLLWLPAVLWLIPGVEIAGLLAAPLPVILTWTFAYAEWPAMIDLVRIGRRSAVVATGPDASRLTARARAHTFFAGMDESELDQADDTEESADAPPAEPARDGTTPPRPPVSVDADSQPPSESLSDLPPLPLTVPLQPADPSAADQGEHVPGVRTGRGLDPTAPYLRQPGGVAPLPTEPGTEADPMMPHGSNHADMSWMLSGFDDNGRVVRYQVRAADVLACTNGYVLGRNPQQCHLVIPDDSVSRRHAHLRLRGKRLMIVDMGSANGTWVDGRELMPDKATEIGHGASVELGGVRLTLTVA